MGCILAGGAIRLSSIKAIADSLERVNDLERQIEALENSCENASDAERALKMLEADRLRKDLANLLAQSGAATAKEAKLALAGIAICVAGGAAL